MPMILLMQSLSVTLKYYCPGAVHVTESPDLYLFYAAF